MTRMKKLTLTGSPYDRGLKHGEEFESEIRLNIENYLDLFRYYGADDDEIYSQVGRFIEIIRDDNPEYLEEMEGVAEGGGFDIEDVTILNSRYELIYLIWKEEAGDSSENVNKDPIKVEGCTTFGATPEGSAQNNTLLCQSWGWKPWVNTFLMDIKRDNKPDILSMTEAGIVGGKIGLNEEGTGLLLNGLTTENDGENVFRKPYHVRFREILDASTLDKSIGSVLTPNRACSANIMLGDPHTGIINIEAGPEKVNYLYPNDGVISHTNHIEGKNLESTMERVFPDTLTRGMRVKQLVSDYKGRIDESKAKSILKDEACGPSSICRSVDADDPEEERVKTMASFVINLTNKTLEVTDGLPTRNGYFKHELNAA